MVNGKKKKYQVAKAPDLIKLMKVRCIAVVCQTKKKRQVGESYPTNSYILGKKSRKKTSTHPLVRTVWIVAAYHLKGKKCETSVVFYGNKCRSIGGRGI